MFAINRAHPLIRGLVAWWPFMEQAGRSANEVISGRRGVITNSSGSPTNDPVWTGSPLGGGLALDGSYGYVSVAHNAALGVLGDMTVVAWINQTNNVGYRYIISKMSGMTPAPFVLRLGNGMAQYYRGDGTSSSGSYALTAVTPNKWSMIAVSDGNGRAIHYLNDALNGGGAFSYTTADAENPVLIGRRGDGYGFAGGIANIRLYNRALAQGEIQALYADPFAGMMKSKAARLLSRKVSSALRWWHGA